MLKSVYLSISLHGIVKASARIFSFLMFNLHVLINPATRNQDLGLPRRLVTQSDSERWGFPEKLCTLRARI